MKEEITLTNKFSYENEVEISYFANTYNKLSCFGYTMCHSKMKCEKVILNNYEEYYIWFRSDLNILRIEIQNASTTPSISNQLKNVNNIRWEFRNITTQQG